MATHSTILAWRMERTILAPAREAWQVVVRGVTESDTAERRTISSPYYKINSQAKYNRNMDSNFPCQTLKYQINKPQTLKYLIKKLVELINKCSKIARCKINTQKPTVLLHTCNEQSKNEIKETIHLQ